MQKSFVSKVCSVKKEAKDACNKRKLKMVQSKELSGKSFASKVSLVEKDAEKFCLKSEKRCKKFCLKSEKRCRNFYALKLTSALA